MDYEVIFKEKLSKMIFLEIKKDAFIKNVLNSQSIHFENNELYLPIDVEFISNNIKTGNKMSDIPINKFIEGMFYALGCDEHFKYNSDYIKLLLRIKDSKEILKSIIAKKVKDNCDEDSFILLRGATIVFNDIEFYEKLLLIGDFIRKKDSNFGSVLSKIILKCKENFKDYALPHFYNALILIDKEDVSGAYVEFNEYLNKGGEKNEEFILEYSKVKDSNDYEKAKELLDEDPNKALEILLPLLEVYGDNAMIYLHIAHAYRVLQNYEKAIYYLNESLSIDDAFVETINEIGLNYALLNCFEDAVMYFRKAFDATKNVEILTNIIMCYINMNNIEEAKKHLEIAKKINHKDEIVLELQKILE